MKDFVVNLKEKYVFFGRYKQENNNLEPIKWRILKNDNNILTLIADKILDCHRFDYTQTDYYKSELRLWLNIDFYNKAFNNNEKQILVKQNDDFVSLLTQEQASILKEQDLQRYVTNYAKQKGTHISLFNKGMGWWWLNTNSPAFPLEAGLVVNSGSICYHFIREDNIGIVPLINIKI